MAKMSPLDIVEQHVEKIVLAVSALLFLFVLVHWGLSSPRKVEVIVGSGGRTTSVSPGEADAVLRQAAADIRRLHQEAEPEPVGWGDLAEVVRRHRQPTLEDYYPNMVFVQPQRWEELPILGHEETQVSLEALAEAIPAPRNPRVNVERVLPQRPEPEETWVAHVAAVYPWGELSGNWQERLRGTRVAPRIVVLGVEAEVQERRPDGQWAEPRTVRGVTFDQDDRVAGRTTAGRMELPTYDGTNGTEVRRAIESLDRTQRQSPRIMQPEYWPIYWPSARRWVDWRVNLPEMAVARLAELVGDAEARSVDVRTEDRRYRDFELERYGESAPMRPAVVDGRSAPDDAEAVPTPTPVPPISAQIESGNVLVWLHDESPQSRRAYRYRVRLRLLNPLYTWDAYVEDAEEARTAAVYTPFSQWSEPREVDPDVRFFVTGALPPQPERDIPGRVVVTVFRHSRGQVVRQRFTVTPGDSIGGVDSVPVMDPVRGERTDTEVNFSTGAVAVDLEFDKEIEVLGRTRTTAEMLYLDDAGRMQSRLLAIDRDSEEYSEMRSRAERAEAATPGERPDWQERPRQDIRDERMPPERRWDDSGDRRRMIEQME